MMTLRRNTILITCILLGLGTLVWLAAITRASDTAPGRSVRAADAAVSPTELATAHTCEYWVAPPPIGTNANPGTSDLPWATLEYASENVPDDHCIVWFGEGVYRSSHRLNRRFETMTTFKSSVPYRAVFEHRGPTVAISGARNITLEGFRFRHAASRARALLVVVDRDSNSWAEMITFRNNIFHDSYNDDLLKIRDGSRFVTVEGNVFYNQGRDEQHLDINSVTDVVVRDNIFFNDHEGSGRAAYDTKHYIVIKDSGEDSDGLLGSERVVVQRNVFLNWQGDSSETFIQVGNDGKPYHEAKDVRVENNLFIGNSSNPTRSVFGVKGARDVVFANNTITGDLPSTGYAFRISVTKLNPPNRNVYFYNNVWSDETGTMDSFTDGDPLATSNLVLDNNLYWNGGRPVPSGEVISPLIDDYRRAVAKPFFNTNHDPVVLPRWNGENFASGNTSIRQEFLRLVRLFAETHANSPTVGKADPNLSPSDDILSRPRGDMPDLGAYEAPWPADQTPTALAMRRP